MHYLVCGGAGFIGVNLCRYLIDRGHTVTVWDNLITGNKHNLPTEVKFEKIDIKDLVPKSYKGVFDGIFNLACPASPSKYQSNPIATAKTCVNGMLNLLDIAQYSDIPILQASTSEVYGNSPICPQREDNLGNVNCTGIRACYDEGKRMAETLCFDHHRTRGTRICVVRIFNTYGPYMSPNDGRIISNFIVQALQGKDMTIYGTGEQTRSFCYVTDTVQGLVQALESGKTGPFNIGNPEERNILGVASIIMDEIHDPNISVVFKPLPQDDPVRRCPDITLARKELNWSPVVGFREGIKKTIEYYKEHHTRIGIVGGGMVGTATAMFGNVPNTTVLVYDTILDRCKPKDTTLNDLVYSTMIFVCVPTPSDTTGRCDTSLVEKVVKKIRELASTKNITCPPIFVRSTVTPGTCNKLDVLFFPEFLREKHWSDDFRTTNTWYVGATYVDGDCTEKSEGISTLQNFIQKAYNSGIITSENFIIVPNTELELAKYARNSFLAVKVAYFNEIYELCTKLDLNWELVRSCIISDNRIGESHSHVPGHDGKFGFGGNCLIKDGSTLVNLMIDQISPCNVLSGAFRTNTIVRNTEN
jgi:UDP-glucuronate decarboxylase